MAVSCKPGSHHPITNCSSHLFSVLQVFAPLARLLGLYSIKEELEALSFMYSDPEGYASVQRRLDVLAKTQGGVVIAVRLSLALDSTSVADKCAQGYGILRSAQYWPCCDSKEAP